jgi:ABC-type multidrug transport system fused ATPase/permease subunit
MLVSQTISSIRTILSLNAVTSMIEKYESATEEAYLYATKDVMKFGLANGTLMSSFLLSYVVVILYGSYLIYDNVRKTGCDPSGASIGAESCDPDGENVFGKYARISHYNGDPKFLSSVSIVDLFSVNFRCVVWNHICGIGSTSDHWIA